ncbi:MAG: hypothetical protein JXB46_07320 [Candidatus Eisenbacteria bacterium]|nr:hypothetical protein [Candidatus Eisenbacteria bacterium]
MRATAALLMGLVLLLHAPANAQIPRTMNYQVMLTDDLDQPLADQAVILELSIFDAFEDGSLLWSEVHETTTNSIGVVSVVLGDTTPLAFDFNRPLWLQLEVDGELLNPRRELTASPFALHSVDSDLLGGASADSYVSGEDLVVPGAINDPSNPVDWTKLKNVPDGFADGTDEAGTGISGSGTAGRVARFTGASTLGNSVIEEIGDGVHISWSEPEVRPALSLGGMGARQLEAALLDLSHDSQGEYTYALINMDIAGDDEFGDYLHCEHHDSAGGVVVTTDFSVSNGGDVTTRGTFEASPYDRRLWSIHARNAYPSNDAHAIHAVYDGTDTYDAAAVYGECVPQDFYGYGGDFVGGYIGVQGKVEPTGSAAYCGVSGYCTGGSGNNTAVAGTASGVGWNYGVYGNAYGEGTNYGVYGESSGTGTHYAGYFDGDARVTGTLYNPLALLEIDHPEDPENSYLRHAFVASSEMKTVYDGTVTLGGDGSVWVTLPDWFESLNGDFRYQLTAIGAPAPRLHVAEKVSNGRFRIAGGEPSMEVSWQVTGIRHDAAARQRPLAVQSAKRVEDRGRYLTPGAFGAPAEQTIGHADRVRK